MKFLTEGLPIQPTNKRHPFLWILIIALLLPTVTQSENASSLLLDGKARTEKVRIIRELDEVAPSMAKTAAPKKLVDDSTENDDRLIGLDSSPNTTFTDTELASVSEPPSATPPHNLSPWSMFMAADWVVKAVMIVLVFASLLTWTVLISKSIELVVLKRMLKRNLSSLSGAKTLTDTTHNSTITGVGRQFVEAAVAEIHLSADLPNQAEGKAGIKERVASSLSRIEVSAGRDMLLGTGVLATIGAIGPFVGLLGTVWGIMNSFIGISQANTTNLAVVAPGIAEALLATAFGLMAAIPAVVIYNHFTRKIAGAKTLVADSAAAVMRLVSRDLDKGIALQPKQSKKAA